MHIISHQVVDISLLGEWSPQFNALVDLYASHLDDFARWRCASTLLLNLPPTLTLTLPLPLTPTPTPTLTLTRLLPDGASSSLVYRKPEAAAPRPRDMRSTSRAPVKRRRSLNHSKRIGSVSNLLAFGPSMAALGDGNSGGYGGYGGGGGARPLSPKMALAFQGWTSHGQAHCLTILTILPHYTYYGQACLLLRADACYTYYTHYV